MPLLKRVEHTYGVDPYVMLGLWGMETAYGDLITNPKHMRPVTPALAALAGNPGAVPIGSRNCSTRWSSWSADGPIRRI